MTEMVEYNKNDIDDLYIKTLGEINQCKKMLESTALSIKTTKNIYKSCFDTKNEINEKYKKTSYFNFIMIVYLYDKLKNVDKTLKIAEKQLESSIKIYKDTNEVYLQCLQNLYELDNLLLN